MIFDVVVSLISVLVGAGIAIATQRYFLRSQERDHRLALAFAIFFKIQSAAEFLSRINAHALDAEREATRARGKLSAALGRIEGAERGPIRFEPAELALLASGGEIELLGRIISLERAHNVLLNVLTRYHHKFDEQVSLSAADTARIAPLAYEVNDLARNVRTVAANGMANLANVLPELSNKLQRVLRDRRFRVSIVAPYAGIQPAGRRDAAHPDTHDS